MCFPKEQSEFCGFKNGQFKRLRIQARGAGDLGLRVEVTSTTARASRAPENAEAKPACVHETHAPVESINTK